MTIDMKDLLIPDENYSETMDEMVTPFLQKRCHELCAARERGRKIHCMYYEADNPRAIVIISHGFTESAEKYKETIFYFLKKRYSVYMPEHCGHGFSYRMSDDYSLVHTDSYERYAEDLLFICRLAKKRHPNEPFYLFAHSMGGGIGAVAASREPGLFSKIILSSPMIRPMENPLIWQGGRMIASLKCLTGKSTDYIFIHHPYKGPDEFEDSYTTSRERFDYYEKKRINEKKFQTCAASYSWLHQADRMNRYLRREAWKHIQAPVLLFQADGENLVSTSQQTAFIQKLNANGNTKNRLVSITGAKHEIFNSPDSVLEPYWRAVFDFLDNTSSGLNLHGTFSESIHFTASS